MDDNADLRLEALETLLEAEKNGAMAAVLIKKRLEKLKGLPKNRRAFFNRLAKGTLEQQIRLDHIISAYSSRPVKKLRSTIRVILRMSVYQLYEMKNIPESAVVNEAVKLARKKGCGQLSGFVNAILRNVIRDPGKVRWPEPDEPVRYISVRYSMPEYLAKKWIEDYGFDAAEKICAAFLEERPVVIHIRQSGGRSAEAEESLSAEAGFFEKIEAPQSAEGCCLRPLEGAAGIGGFDTPAALTAFREGLIYVQDIGSQIAVNELAPADGMNILDICAAPGGKSMTAADMAGENACVTARDISPEKVALIDENIKRCKMENILTEAADASVFREHDCGKYDAVIADLPCSGYGVIGRKPDIKYNASREKEDELIRIQRQILDNAARYVKRGGRLLYSTCTLNRRENEENAHWFAAKHDFTMEKCFTLFPGSYPGDGFFVSVFTRN